MKLNQHTRYQGQWSFCIKVIVRTQRQIWTQTDTRLIALFGPLKWSVKIYEYLAEEKQIILRSKSAKAKG